MNSIPNFKYPQSENIERYSTHQICHIFKNFKKYRKKHNLKLNTRPWIWGKSSETSPMLSLKFASTKDLTTLPLMTSFHTCASPPSTLKRNHSLNPYTTLGHLYYATLDTEIE